MDQRKGGFLPAVGRYEGIPHHAGLNVLIGGEKFTVVVEGNPLFSLHKAFNMGTIGLSAINNSFPLTMQGDTTPQV